MALDTKSLLIGGAIGAIIMHLLMKKKKVECPKCGNSVPQTLIQTAFPATPPPPTPPPPPPPPAPKPEPKPTPLPPAPPVVPESKSFVGFYGWGHVK